MAEQTEKFVNELPARRIAYDYDNPSHPFTPEQIAYIESIREFLSDSEIAQARRIETFSYNTFFGNPNEIGIAGLRPQDRTYCMYLRRFDERPYGRLVDEFLDAVYEDFSEDNIDRVNMPGYRVTTPDGDRYYAFVFNGDLQAWIDRLVAVAGQHGTLMAWFDRGKFCLTDGRQLPFSDLLIEKLEGGKPLPKGW